MTTTWGSTRLGKEPEQIILSLVQAMNKKLKDVSGQILRSSAAGF